MLWKSNLKSHVFEAEEASSESLQLKTINKQQDKENGDTANSDKAKPTSICIDARKSDRYKRPAGFIA